MRCRREVVEPACSPTRDPDVALDRERCGLGADSNRGERDDDAGCDEGRRHAADQTRRRAVARRVEHRQQSAFQLSSPRHRHGQRRRASARRGCRRFPAGRSRSRWLRCRRARTRSSQANSRSTCRRRAAHQTPGCGQYTARASEASVCVKQSRRCTCAISWRITERRRSAVQASASSETRMAGRRRPTTIGITCAGARSSRTGVVTPSALAAASTAAVHCASRIRSDAAYEAPRGQVIHDEPDARAAERLRRRRRARWPAS